MTVGTARYNVRVQRQSRTRAPICFAVAVNDGSPRLYHHDGTRFIRRLLGRNEFEAPGTKYIHLFQKVAVTALEGKNGAKERDRAQAENSTIRQSVEIPYNEFTSLPFKSLLIKWHVL